MLPSGLDLDAYLQRIGYAGPLAPSAATLAALHLAHATAIPFENVDVLLGHPVALDLASLQDKLVDRRRGGYCFEHNLLFAEVLRVLGFGVTMLAARVRFQATRVLPRTHMLLAVETDAGRQLADVGFGGGGPLLPIPLAAGAASTQYHWHYRLAPEGDGFILQAGHGTGFADLYAFSLEPFVEADFEMANFYVSRHPASRFVRALAVRLPTPAAQHLLRNREYSIDRGAGPVPQARLDDPGIVRVLADVFGIEVAAGTAFPLEQA